MAAAQVSQNSKFTTKMTVNEHLPTPLDATSEQPPLFDGTTRLFANYACPFAQRVWITRNYKGLYDKIKLVPIDLQNRPAWYKEKVHHENKVPALEHNGKIIRESLDLIKYVDSNFEGPSLLPDDPAKKQFAEEFIAFTDSLINKTIYKSFKGDTVKEAGPDFDRSENALHNFDDGPFFLGHEFSLELNKIDAYKPRRIPKWLLNYVRPAFRLSTEHDRASTVPLEKQMPAFM